ncbi:MULTISPECIES: hypothetical protein [unclassified Nocardiopsis]|uniref:hypothetical protein n=1 Tax=unclassified Nocardiopsis TaxID=2649073 RepID=UPI00340438FA
MNPISITPAVRGNRVSGAACPSCEHRSCRSCRAQHLPRLGGHRAEFTAEHARAALLQQRHRDLVIYFGESTQSYWVASATGLHEAGDWDHLLAHLWGRDRLRRSMS